MCRSESLIFFVWPIESSARRLLGTSGAPLASSSDDFFVASSTGISYTSDDERDSTRSARVGAVARVEEMILEHPAPTLELSRIKLILTIHSVNHVTEPKGEELRHTTGSWTKARLDQPLG
ncbi:hypothetical protein GW17_00048599 [Ensete ventricosum]|nr:hypothetical protein GW17_00048599 [Ensete ventricosum]RZS29263.1 hypothetical protein BHM03_00062973 [Ensete ventricosum]